MNHRYLVMQSLSDALKQHPPCDRDEQELGIQAQCAVVATAYLAMHSLPVEYTHQLMEVLMESMDRFAEESRRCN